MNNYDYIVNSFTKEEENVNLEVDNLSVGCITSKNNNFNLDSDGNLTVRSITSSQGLIARDSIRDLVYPIGAIYMSVNNINPSTFIGGSWEEWGAGRVAVGVDSTQTEFNQPEKIGGEKSHKLTINEMPKHIHEKVYVTGIPLTLNSNSGSDAINVAQGAGGASSKINGIYTGENGGGQSHNNLQPYITCYMWKRNS